MERKLKEIVVDKSSLSWLRDVDGLYVDKTKYLLKMICSGSYFLFSRPRRFGKSLTIDTFEQIFKGNKELFKGLYIYDEYDFEEYPVIRLNMSLTPFSDLLASRRSVKDSFAWTNDLPLNFSSLTEAPRVLSIAVTVPFFTGISAATAENAVRISAQKIFFIFVSPICG